MRQFFFSAKNLHKKCVLDLSLPEDTDGTEDKQHGHHLKWGKASTGSLHTTAESSIWVPIPGKLDACALVFCVAKRSAT